MVVNEHTLVLELTAASAGEALDARLLSALAAAVRSDDAALRCAWAALQSRLRTADANVRCRALLLAAHLFKRSKLFRELLATWLPVRAHGGCMASTLCSALCALRSALCALRSALCALRSAHVLCADAAVEPALTRATQKFIVCTLGSAERPLPPPRAAAARLHELAQRTLQQWTETWGEHYPALRVALRHVAERRDVAVAAEAAAPADRAHARREARAAAVWLRARRVADALACCCAARSARASSRGSATSHSGLRWTPRLRRRAPAWRG
jgi:hypothetical protein